MYIIWIIIKKKKDLKYLDIINIFNLSNIHYNENIENNKKYYKPDYNNYYLDYSQSAWNMSNISDYSYYQQDPNKHIIQENKNNYSNY